MEKADAPPGGGALSAEAESCDEGPVPIDVFPVQVPEETPALAHKTEQASPRVVVVSMFSQMVRDVTDPLGEERHLDLGGAGVARLLAEALHQLLCLRFIQFLLHPYFYGVCWTVL